MIHRRANTILQELVITGELKQGWEEDFATLWNHAMDEANLPE